jgi:hypothetical protein
VDGAVVEATLKLIRKIASNKDLLRKALKSLNDAAVLHLAYVCNIEVPQNQFEIRLIEAVLQNAEEQGILISFTGELMRRHPELLQFD